MRTPGGTQALTVISESGFYDVVVRSDKPQGKALRSLVTREVLPQLAALHWIPSGGQMTPKCSNGLRRRGLRRAASRRSGRPGPSGNWVEKSPSFGSRNFGVSYTQGACSSPRWG